MDKERLSILHINTQDVPGGAAKSTYRLARIQERKGHRVNVLVGYKNSDSPNYHTLAPVVDMDRHHRCRKEGWLYYEFENSFRLVHHPLVQAADVIHCHNLHGDFFNPFSISVLSHYKPVVWSLRDMQALTGHCAYSLDCDKWQSGCGHCPYPEIYPGLLVDNTERLWKDKRLIYEHSFIWIAAISNWIKGICEKGILNRMPVECIHNMTDTNIFKPYDQETARNKFGIPLDSVVLGAAAQGGTLSNPFKGGEYTLAAIELLAEAHPDMIFVNIGADRPSKHPCVIDIPHIDNENDLAQLYSALDIFLYTPRAETFSLVVLEALACATPVVTFRTGGVPELVRHGKDGFVVDFQDVPGLVKAAEKVIADPHLRLNFSRSARERVLSAFDPNQTYEKYLDLYLRCIEQHPRLVKRPKLFPLEQLPDILKTRAFFSAEQFKVDLARNTSKSNAVPWNETDFDVGTSKPLLIKADSFYRAGCFEEALNCYRKILMRRPRDADVYNNMGMAFKALRRWQEAQNCFEAALTMDPAHTAAHNNLGIVYGNIDSWTKAVDCFRRAISVDPHFAEAQNNLGNALAAIVDIPGAYQAYQQALALKPDYAEAHNNLGNLYQKQGRFARAVAHYHQALSIKPSYANALNNLGCVLVSQGKVSEAIDILRRALSIEPNLADAHNNLANALAGAGWIDEALPQAQRALNLAPQNKMYASNVLMHLQYKTDTTPDVICDCSKRLFSKLDQQTPAFSRGLSHWSGQSRLNVGFVSPDFRRHSVSFFFLPLLQALDRKRIKVFCYSNVIRPDGVTRRTAALADRWCSITGLGDHQAAEIIAEDGIDVLIDLAGHTSGNRLGVFAHKPAPVQITWLGYPGTTGLASMDYRLTDDIADPPGRSDNHYSEKLLRLPRGFLCYSPVDRAPPVADPPCLKTGCITFGSFNNLPKINAGVVSLWSQLLDQVPGSRLLLKARQLADPTICQNIRKQFHAHNIAPERVLFVPRVDTTAEHLDLYRHVDIALDPFPYNGTTTTCEALWMGVPVITLCGNRHSARVGASILTRCGLSQLVAYSLNSYTRIGTRLAGDIEELQHLRQSLRNRVHSSRLCNAKGFAEQFTDLLFDTTAEEQRLQNEIHIAY